MGGGRWAIVSSYTIGSWVKQVVCPRRRCLTRALAASNGIFWADTDHRRPHDCAPDVKLPSANGKSALSNSSKDHGGPDGMEPDGIIEVCAWNSPSHVHLWFDIYISDLYFSFFFQSNWTEITDNFDDMNLKESLLRGIYAYGFEKPSAIQQRAIIPCIKGMEIYLCITKLCLSDVMLNHLSGLTQ